MSFSIATCILAVTLTGFASGCATCGQVSYPGRAPTSPPSDIRVTADHRNELHVSLASRALDAGQLTILSAESRLTDAHGRAFHLEFQPNDYANRLVRESPPDRYASMLDYFVKAHGPMPGTSDYSFADGQYTISVAFIESGERRIAQTTLVLHWRTITVFHWLFTRD